MYKKDLALNNLQGLICHKTKPKQTVYAGIFVSLCTFQSPLVYTSSARSLISDKENEKEELSSSLSWHFKLGKNIDLCLVPSAVSLVYVNCISTEG